MPVERWNWNMGSKNRNLRDEIRIVDEPVARRFYPEVKIFITNPWGAKGVASCDAVRSEDGCCDLRQRATEGVACDINWALILVRLFGLRECLMKWGFADFVLERKERPIKSFMDQKF